MVYYSRSENDTEQKEHLSAHLSRVRALCREYAAALGCPRLGEWMGVTHDFGKYSRLFAAVLAGTAHHVDHALPGAALLYSRLGSQKTGSPGWAAVLAVRAHHGQLQECGPELRHWQQGTLMQSSQEGKQFSLVPNPDGENGPDSLSTAFPAFMAENSPLPAAPLASELLQPAEQTAAMLRARMLLSCLVDADYCASAEYFTSDYLAKTTAAPLDAAASFAALEAYRSTLDFHGDPAMGQLRSTLYRVCCEAGASQSPGLFTLTAPTGAGKTLAMLGFALQQMLHFNKRRIIVVLPFLSLTEQSAAIYRKIVPQLLEDHSQARIQNEENEFARELTARWASPFIITTSVRFFEDLFACRSSACRPLHEIAGSVILFDEAQSLPAPLAPATLKTMQLLCSDYGCSVVFSTATQPDFSALPEVQWAPREIVPDVQPMFDAARRVDTEWRLSAPTGWEALASELVQQPSVCVIVNLRKHARALYQAAHAAGREHVYYLSTDLCPAHRTALLAEIRQRLNENLPCCLISTQCIEAGVDLSFDSMYRALAPLESIIQAAGRCNRSDTRRRGRLVVFEPEVPPGEHLYPDTFYEQCANAVKTLLSRHPIDLYGQADIREYYHLIFAGKHEKRALQEAIAASDYERVAKEYRLIPGKETRIIVPYPAQLPLYETLCARLAHGLTAAIMQQAAPISVSSYLPEETLRRYCVPIFLPARGGAPSLPSGWYLAGDAALYKTDLGFSIPEEPNTMMF